ncbi:hypothetical protein HNP82_001312 [Catenibacillus scindens]|uniref:Uncharacterized protein n=1 Tax=Catenibacillus scindens TaxID=673271 RepID=A0A7W8H969_9FIRM|nr:hypothetical protein [Catenibacillus scindens]
MLGSKGLLTLASYQVKIVNKLQTVKRCREFNIDEITILYNLGESTNTREDCIVGVYLLLGTQ